jgi:hypothetical protein
VGDLNKMQDNQGVKEKGGRVTFPLNQQIFAKYQPIAAIGS